jgi:hypothetical protein
MNNHLAADVAHVLAALHESKAWFRHGLSDERLCELTGLPLQRVIAARRQAAARGFIERQGIGSEHVVTTLTPVGVAHVRAEQVGAEEREA